MMKMKMELNVKFFSFLYFLCNCFHNPEIFADESDEEEPENAHLVEYDEEEDISEEMDESDEVDEVDDDDIEGQSEISSEEDDENLIHTNGIKKINQHLGIHQSDIDLLGIDGPPSDSYLQTMNDNLHKKFRRQNHQYSAPTDFLHNNNNQIYQPGQVNGDYKNNLTKPIVDNGQDDDDIVLVSDDDSEEKKSNSILVFGFS
jgi:hypothetical protein